MKERRIGVQLDSLQAPFKKALLMAAKMGANAVEINARGEMKPSELTATGARHVRKMLDDLNLRVSAVSFRTLRGYEIAENLENRVEGTKAAMRMAWDLGANVVINAIGHVPEPLEGPSWDLLRQAIADLGAFGQKVGAMLCADTGPEDQDQLAKLLDQVPEGSLGINFNPGALILHGNDPSQFAQVLGSSIWHVHATDATRDRARGRGIETPLGRGSAEFPELLGILERHSYRGYFTVSRPPSANVIAELESAMQFLNNL